MTCDLSVCVALAVAVPAVAEKRFPQEDVPS